MAQTRKPPVIPFGPEGNGRIYKNMDHKQALRSMYSIQRPPDLSGGPYYDKNLANS